MSSPFVWLVRENAGGTGTWQTVDTFLYASGKTGPNSDSAALGVAADNFGNVYAIGYAFDALGTSHWIVRKP